VDGVQRIGELKMLNVKWHDAGREPKSAPDPDFPTGTDIDVTEGATATCKTDLPYPARRCGQYLISCSDCGMNVLITTAGRPDDPRSIRIPCKAKL
jgi:hypothetical protein